MLYSLVLFLSSHSTLLTINSIPTHSPPPHYLADPRHCILATPDHTLPAPMSPFLLSERTSELQHSDSPSVSLSDSSKAQATVAHLVLLMESLWALHLAHDLDSLMEPLLARPLDQRFELSKVSDSALCLEWLLEWLKELLLELH